MCHILLQQAYSFSILVDKIGCNKQKIRIGQRTKEMEAATLAYDFLILAIKNKEDQKKQKLLQMQNRPVKRSRNKVGKQLSMQVS